MWGQGGHWPEGARGPSPQGTGTRSIFNRDGAWTESHRLQGCWMHRKGKCPAHKIFALGNIEGYSDGLKTPTRIHRINQIMILRFYEIIRSEDIRTLGGKSQYFLSTYHAPSRYFACMNSWTPHHKWTGQEYFSPFHRPREDKYLVQGHTAQMTAGL